MRKALRNTANMRNARRNTANMRNHAKTCQRDTVSRRNALKDTEPTCQIPNGPVYWGLEVKRLVRARTSPHALHVILITKNLSYSLAIGFGETEELVSSECTRANTCCANEIK